MVGRNGRPARPFGFCAWLQLRKSPPAPPPLPALPVARVAAGAVRRGYFAWLHPAAKARRLTVETLLAVVIVVKAQAAQPPPWLLRCPHGGAFALVTTDNLARGPPTCAAAGRMQAAKKDAQGADGGVGRFPPGIPAGGSRARTRGNRRAQAEKNGRGTRRTTAGSPARPAPRPVLPETQQGKVAREIVTFLRECKPAHAPASLAPVTHYVAAGRDARRAARPALRRFRRAGRVRPVEKNSETRGEGTTAATRKTNRSARGRRPRRGRHSERSSSPLARCRENGGPGEKGAWQPVPGPAAALNVRLNLTSRHIPPSAADGHGGNRHGWH